MEPALPILRPPALTRLCVLSFINQGLLFPVYLFGIAAAAYTQRTDPAALQQLADSFYAGMLGPNELEQMHRFLTILQEHGVALMSVFTLRTLARAIGVWRMWHLHWDGFHIYTTAQLLGILLPMLVAGSALFSLLGLLVAVMWCLMYWARMRPFRHEGSMISH